MSAFDEWRDTTSGWTEDELQLAEVAWNAALDEAAKVCADIQRKTDKWGPMAGYCAETILALKDAKP